MKKWRRFFRANGREMLLASYFCFVVSILIAGDWCWRNDKIYGSVFNFFLSLYLAYRFIGHFSKYLVSKSKRV
jgi:hypothetical protein